MLAPRNELVDLVERAMRGDGSAMDQLLRRSTPMVQAMLRAYTGDHEDQRDLLQEVLWEVYRSLRKLRDPSKYPAWLARVAGGKAIDSLRRLYRQDELISYEAGIRLDDYPTPEIKDAFLDPLYRDLLQALERAIERLPERYQRALALRLVDGLGIQEIAEALDQSPGTVKSLLSRGIIRLRDNFEIGA
ncbi:MAG: RNA polymerase sigma factor [Planctomycetota bacterium]|jgi:RNA polymerase sigma-70 factor (ECF subfamily)